MNILSNSVYNYYFSLFDELTLDKQFHFASRLYAVNGDALAKEKLEQLQTTLIGDSTARQVLSAIQSGTLFPLLPGNADLLETRAPYITKYPHLRDTSRLLYWSAMLSHAYKFDTKDALESLTSTYELEKLYNDLLDDHAAIATLSTHAVNYLYLYKRFYKNEAGPDPSLFLAILTNESRYDYSDPLQLRLAVYMITHALIADTLFYFTPVPKNHMPQHRNTIEQIEAVITEHLELLSIDAQLEFILCCKLVGYVSPLESLVLDESRLELSSAGTFIIDASKPTQNLNSSEHRNALYLLCTAQPAL